MKQDECLQWLDDQTGYYVQWSEAEEKFPDVMDEVFGVTCKYDSVTDTTWVPIRDIRQTIKYGIALD